MVHAPRLTITGVPCVALHQASVSSRSFLAMSSGDEGFGDHCFKGVVAEKYLSKQGLSAAVLDDPSCDYTTIRSTT